MKRPTVLAVILGAGAVVLAAGLGAQQPAAPGGQGRRGGGRGFTFPPVGAIEKVAGDLYTIPGQGGNTAVFVTQRAWCSSTRSSRTTVRRFSIR